MKKIILMILLSPMGILAQTPPESPAVATVNGEKITKFDLDAYHAQKLFVVGNKKVTKENSLNELIQRKLTIQKAIKEKADQDDQIRDKMNEVLFQAQVAKDVSNKFKDIRVSDQEAIDLFTKNPEYRTSQILYRVPVFPKPDELKEAYSAILEIHKKLIDNPSKWNELSKTQSMAMDLPPDGDVGYQPFAALAPEYYAAIKGQKVGFLSKPVRSQYGYHIIKITGIKELKDMNKNVYKKIIYDQKRDAVVNAYFEGLKTGSKISVNKELLK